VKNQRSGKVRVRGKRNAKHGGDRKIRERGKKTISREETVWKENG
jgi:hypothetical protein